ncbi:MAG TPA: methylamine utilization protein [Candidatus Binatia bacterium]|nr:methylamine utilization protein [Candidatus Binatia bacterium]
MIALVAAVAAGAAPARTGAAEIVGRVVDGDGAPVADAVVFADVLPAGVHPPSATPTAVMDQVQKQFVPHVLPVVVGTQVAFPNRDQIHHHVYSFSRTKTFELPLYKGEDAPPVLFDRVGAVKVGCNIHDWMSGVILVVPTPYFAVTDASGSFALRDLPAGTYGLVAWHERQKSGEEARLTAVASVAPAPLAIALDLAPARVAPARGGTRGYE